VGGTEAKIRHPSFVGAKLPAPMVSSKCANKVVPFEKHYTELTNYSCLRDSDEMVFTDPSGNTDQGV
jgi:hypothetical protein